MRVAPLFFGLLVVAIAQCVSADTYQGASIDLFKRQVDPSSGGAKTPKGPKDKDSNESKDSNGSKDSKENNNNNPGFGGKHCASVSIPARVAIQFCGCNDPACPRCPCKADGEA